MEPIYVYFQSYLHFKTPSAWRMLQRCFAVNLQKCFEDYKTQPNYTSALGWVDNDWISIFFFFLGGGGWSYPLILPVLCFNNSNHSDIYISNLCVSQYNINPVITFILGWYLIEDID